MANYSNFDLRKFLAESKNVKEEEVNEEEVNEEEVEESAPGFEHDCAAHVVHETYGYGICLEGQHTLVENAEGKHVVTHYDVFFKEGSQTVENIPVEELKVLTESNHGHAKNKKKNEEVLGEGPEGKVMKFLTNLFDKVTGIDKFNECSNNDWQGEECQKLKMDIGYAAGVKSGFEKSSGTTNVAEESTELTKEEAFKNEIKDILDS